MCIYNLSKTLCECWLIVTFVWPHLRIWKERCKRRWLRRCLTSSVTQLPPSSYWQWPLPPRSTPPTEMRSAAQSLYYYDLTAVILFHLYYIYWQGVLLLPEIILDNCFYLIMCRSLTKELPTLRITPISLAPQPRRLLLLALLTRARWRESRLP